VRELAEDAVVSSCVTEHLLKEKLTNNGND